LHWDAVTDMNDEKVASYRIQLRKNHTENPGQFVYTIKDIPAQKDPGKIEEFNLENLEAKTTYTFRILSIDKSGNKSKWSNDMEITTN